MDCQAHVAARSSVRPHFVDAQRQLLAKRADLEQDRNWAGFHPKADASNPTVRLLDFDGQDDDVSGAAQDRTPGFAARSSSAPADFRMAEPSEQE
ncbi:hypothetical protein UP10_41380 [Bradyrhizobium sp. LTSPM299]|nr:hypothetical protein UP10_41380 [Bradyrhizobium sp. LTSPM299]